MCRNHYSNKVGKCEVALNQIKKTSFIFGPQCCEYQDFPTYFDMALCWQRF